MDESNSLPEGRSRIEVQRFCFTFRACHDLQLSSARRKRTLYSPRLNCQQDGVGKKPLSKEGFEGKNLFWDARKLFLFQQDYKSKPSMYLGRLVDMLMGVRGTNSVRQRRKERKIAADRDPSRNDKTTPRLLLTKEFFYIIERK